MNKSLVLLLGFAIFIVGCTKTDVTTRSGSTPPEPVNLNELIVPEVYDGCGKECSDIVKRMAFSIDMEPELWKTSGFELTRIDGPSIWIANEDYAISIGPTKFTMTKLSPSRGPDMKLLWRAFTRWQQTQIAQGRNASNRYQDKEH